MFINHVSNEICFTVAYFGCSKDRVVELLSQLRQKVPSEGYAAFATSSGTAALFSFLPPGLAKLRGLSVRMFVRGVVASPTAAAATALLGSDVIVLLNEEAEAWPLLREASRAAATPVSPETLIVLNASGAPNPPDLEPGTTTLESAKDSVMVPLKHALRLALGALKRPEPEPSEPLVAVFIPPLRDLLFAFERAAEAPLTEPEVLRVRDTAPCVMLTAERARALEATRGYPDLRPEHVWSDWRAARGA